MQTQFSADFLSTETGREADSILRRCVHCGFCNATCPTYQLLGDELDGPRGRIYLIKQFLEGEASGAVASLHLDRCLTCRNCETTCPSGVQYGRLLDIGREQIEAQVTRSPAVRFIRWVLSFTLSRPVRFKIATGVAGAFGFFLPESLKKSMPVKITGSQTAWPEVRHARRIILLQGCVQDVLEPGINKAAAQLLDRLSISAIRVNSEVCCGALDQHLAQPEKAEHFMRRNIDAWWPYVEQGAEAIISTASACGVQVKDYGYYLKNDSQYAEKAKRISELARDIAELVDKELVDSLDANSDTKQVTRIAFHAPCTLQHGQGLGGVVEGILQRWGYEILSVSDSHLCCGSAGTYSVLNPGIASTLRDNKVGALTANQPDIIASANIGCLQHIRKASPVPVKHWIELLGENQP